MVELMEWNPLKWPLSCIAALCGIICFLIFIPTSISLFAGKNYIGEPYNIVIHYLSDLGNFIYNPRGAIFFNIGLILLGTAIMFFYIGIAEFKDKVPRTNLIRYVQIIGVFSGISLIFVGIFPENAPELHFYWSIIFFIGILLDFSLAAITLKGAPNVPQFIVYYAILAAVIDLLLVILLLPIFEWMTAITTNIFTGLMIPGMLRLE